MSANFNEKIVLITGASSGMGKATALDLASRGAKAITLFARRKEALDTVAQEIATINPETKTLVVVGDASKAEDNQRAVEETVKTFGGVTSAFINAGIFRGGTSLHMIQDEEIESLLNLNVKGVIYAFRYLIPAIETTLGKEEDNNNKGSIVVNSGIMGHAVIAPKSVGASIYIATKAFVNSLVKTAAIENAPGIRVNGVMPGLIQTEILPTADDDTYETIAKSMQPLYGRVGKASEVGSLVSYLIGDESSFISGTSIKIDGLWSLSGGEFPEI